RRDMRGKQDEERRRAKGKTRRDAGRGGDDDGAGGEHRLGSDRPGAVADRQADRRDRKQPGGERDRRETAEGDHARAPMALMVTRSARLTRAMSAAARIDAISSAAQICTV